MNQISDHIQPPSEGDRHWQAFRYLQGELSATEAEQFELQMLSDTELCAIVAKTSVLTAAVSASEPVVAHRQAAQPHAVTANSRLPRSLAVIVVAGCCAAAALFISTNEFRTSGPSPAAVSVNEADFLLNAWADSGATETDSDDTELDPADDQELNVPDWMLAAVSGAELPDPDESESEDVIRDLEDVL